MKKLTCEFCGSPNVAEENGLFICSDCKKKYLHMSFEELIGVGRLSESNESLTTENKIALGENVLHNCLQAYPDSHEVLYACAKYAYTVYASKECYEIYQKLYAGKPNEHDRICNPSFRRDDERLRACSEQMECITERIRQLSEERHGDIINNIHEIDLMIHTVKARMEPSDKEAAVLS